MALATVAMGIVLLSFVVALVFCGWRIRHLRLECKRLDDNVCTLIDVIECEYRQYFREQGVVPLADRSIAEWEELVQDRDN